MSTSTQPTSTVALAFARSVLSTKKLVALLPPVATKMTGVRSSRRLK